MRRREVELSKVLLECPEGRAEQRRRTSVGGAVPAGTDKFLTPAIQQVRDNAAKRREQKKARAPGASKKKTSKYVHRWLGEGRGGRAPPVCGGDTPPAREPAGFPLNVLIPADHPAADVLFRRQALMSSRPAKFMERAIRTHPKCPRLLIVPAFRPDTLVCDAVWVRVFGGFVTCTSWMMEALRADRAPPGVLYRGVVEKKLTLCLTEGMVANHVKASLALKVAMQECCRVTDGVSIESMRVEHQAYLERNGGRSQPWRRMCIVVAEEEHQAIVEQIGEASRMVRTLTAFLNEFSVAKKQLAPGRWRCLS